MKSVNFFYTCFSIAIIYQLFINNQVNNIVSETNEIYIENNSIVSTNIKVNESVEVVEHLKRPVKYKMSKNGHDFIKKQEICVLHAYNDPDPQRRSVGWGHQIRPGENLEHITQKKADELFVKDIEWVNDAINRLIAQNDSRFIYTQGFIDGLGSLIYNCGERGVTLTEFYARWQRCRYDKTQPGYINKNDLNFTIAAVKTSRISAPGHITRRYDEHKLMLD